MQPESFEIRIGDAALGDLRERLARTRFAPDFANDDWRYGVPGAYLAELVEYWREEYDWRQQEKAMNRFANFRVTLDDVPIHFVHERGVGPAPIPLILTHGWPWSFWDFRDVIGPLSNPAAHGGDPADAFDVVVPSLPASRPISRRASRRWARPSATRSSWFGSTSRPWRTWTPGWRPAR